MANLIKVLDNGRILTRSANALNGTAALIEQGHQASTDWTVDWSDWLGAQTIASASNETYGPSVTEPTISGAQTAITISGDSGWIIHRITTSAGQIKELRIRVKGPETIMRDDYGWMRA